MSYSCDPVQQLAFHLRTVLFAESFIDETLPGELHCSNQVVRENVDPAEFTRRLANVAMHSEFALPKRSSG